MPTESPIAPALKGPIGAFLYRDVSETYRYGGASRTCRSAGTGCEYVRAPLASALHKRGAMRTRRTVTTGLVLAFVLAPCRPASANGDEPAAFDGNAGAPDQRGALQQTQIQGTQTENVQTRSSSWRVGPAGDTRWSEELEVVPGINGVQPSLSVEYNSQAENGLVGQGFSLVGLPAIVRVHGTDNGITEDSEPRGVQFDDHDSFAVAPGGWGTPVSMRGRLVAGANGSATYHTAMESWTQFTPHGNCGEASFAPCVWVAEDGQGNTYYYGASNDGRLWERDTGQDSGGVPVGARGVMAWGLTHVQDEHGNLYSVRYFSDEFMLYPERIEYGCPASVDPGPLLGPPAQPEEDPPGGKPPVIDFDPGTPVDSAEMTTNEILGATGPFVELANSPPSSSGTTTVTVTVGGPPPQTCTGGRTVQFEYETRPDITAMPSRYTNRLQSVKMTAGGQHVRGYRFSYEDEVSPSWGRSRLHRFIRVGAGQFVEDEPVTFGWSNGKMINDVQEDRSWAVGGDDRVSTIAADVNGDGLSDLIRVSFGEDGRKVTWALGQREASEEGQAPLGPISAPIGVAGDQREWSATVADIDADGRDDLVLWTLHEGAGEVQFHRGIPGGLGPMENYADNAGVETFAQAYGREKKEYRLLIADINGDQLDDMVLVNRYKADSGRVGVALGGPSGFGDLEFLGGASLSLFGDVAALEPIIHDIDGDGIDDLVVGYSVSTGLTSQVFLGRSDGLQPARILAWARSVSSEACPGTCFDEPECACNGVTPFQTLRTDVNGDGIGDITLAYTGVAVEQGHPSEPPTPFGRNIQSWLGQGDFSALQLLGQDRIADEAVHQILDSTTYPSIDYGSGNYARWEHHSGDVNGDGFSDVVAFYAGVEGLRAGYSFGTPTGELSPMTTITGCAASSEDADWGDSCAPMADGDVEVHRWHSLVVDIDSDGRSDLLRYYAGDDGRLVEVARGGPAGLTGFTPLLSGSPILESKPDDLANASSVRLLAADFNGDGARDLVLASQDAVILRPSRPAPDQSEERPDLLVSVDDGYAGVVEFEYEMAARLDGAIDPDASECGNAAGEDCGTANRSSRPLATRVLQRDGRGGVLGTAYRYANGRYYPGPVVVNTAGARPHARADLAFEWVEATDEQTDVITRTHYYQDPDRKRLPQKEEQFAPFHPFHGGAPTSLISRRKTFDYERSSTPFNTQKVELRADHEQSFEWGMNGFEINHEYDYDQYGGQSRAVECADSICMEMQSEYASPVLSPGSYRVRRLLETKSHRVGDERAVSWSRYNYEGDLLRSTEQLLCKDAEECWCYEDAASCIDDGSGEWVATADDLEYDGFGNVIGQRDAVGIQTRVEFDTQYHTYPDATESEVEDATGVLQTRRTERTYDDAGRVRTVTDLNGNVTERVYDALGRQRSVTYPNGRVESWDYENLGNANAQLVRHRELVDVNTGEERFQEQFFDGLGRNYKVRASAGADVAVVLTEWQFEKNGAVSFTSDPRLESEAGAILWTKSRLDPRGRVVEINRIEGSVGGGQQTNLGTSLRRFYGPTTFTEERNQAPVDDDGRILGNDWTQSTHIFDSRGNLVSMQRHGSHTDYSYDHGLRLRTVWGPHAPGVTESYMLGQFVEYDYDTFGRTRIANDTEGWTLFDYDAVGNLLSTDDANGDQNSYTYDAWGRLRSRTSSGGVESFLYDQFQNGIGQLTTVSGPWGSDVVSGGFDEVGHLLARTVDLLGLASAQTESFEYRADGRLLLKTLPDGTELAYGYRNSGDLVTVAKNGVQFLELDQFNADGNPGLRITPASMTSYEYNADGRLLALNSQAPGGSGDAFVDYMYSYDAAGNVLGIVDQRGDTKVGATDTSDTWSFIYDRFGQLETAVDFQGAKTHYSYDEATRITSKGDRVYTYGPQTIDIDDDGKVTHLEHDDMGRLKSKVGASADWKYTHDSLGRLTSTSRDSKIVASMDYNASGKRVRKVENVGGEFVTTWYVSPNYELREDSRDPGNVVPTVVVDGGGNGVVATETMEALTDAPNEEMVTSAWADPLNVGHAGGAPKGVYFHHHNHIGSTSVITNANGDVVSVYRNTPWGERKDGGTGFDIAFREFTGQVRDEQTELLYYGARYYDPDVGRFLEPDTDDFGMPFFPDAGSMNRHTYVKNNPVRYTDPTGHNPLDPKDGIVRGLRRDADRWNAMPSWEPYDPSIDDALLKEGPTLLGRFGNWLRDHTKVQGKIHLFGMKFTPGIDDEDGGLKVKKGSTPSLEIPLPRGLSGSGSVSVDENENVELKLGIGVSRKKGKLAKVKAQAYAKASVNEDHEVVVKPGVELGVSLKAIEHVLSAEVTVAVEGDPIPVADASDYVPLNWTK